MGVSSKAILMVVALSSLRCFAHWRLTKPVPRSGGAYENNPLPADANTKEEWVWRNANPNPSVERPTFDPGQPMGAVYGTGSIGHVGDCAVYISYDVMRPRRTMRWVKIANLPDCRQQINQLVQIVIPSVLPAGNAVFRWDQAATHQIYNADPFVEWFIQCADIIIRSSSTRSWESFNSFSMIDNNGVPVYPADVSSYRKNNQAAVNDADFWMTGPACVDDSINQCALTAVGTKGYTGFGGEVGGAVVSSSPSATLYGSTAVPTTSVPKASTFTARKSTTENDAMCCYDPSCATYGTSFCNSIDSWCSGSEDACTTCGGTLCVETRSEPAVEVHSGQQQAVIREPEPESEEAAEPEPESETEAESEPEPETQVGVEKMPAALTPTPSQGSSPSEVRSRCCFYGGCAFHGMSYCYGVDHWCARSSQTCSSCSGSWCTGMSLLSKANARQRRFLRKSKFLGNSLVQTNADSQKIQPSFHWNWIDEEL